ncbi:hypothetical protein HPB52_012667 [Rhipicephalus sanguineus]|uniref:Methyltransferase type 11 domain-containing protein n=1 Tax=Rhipicephalus sanguineus TaxID=34632 RepID=A0A9D4SRF4_RHISA|nr:hypothetical protein HPB52_012667 [Rhipicephalus sanguineus]
MIGSRLRSIEGLHDFMRLTGVVKECVRCAPPVDGCSMQLQELGNDCWRLVRRYPIFDNRKCSTIAKAGLLHVPLNIRTKKYIEPTELNQMAHYHDRDSQAESEPSQEDERVEVYDRNCQSHLGIVADLLDTFHKAFAPCEDEYQQFLDIGCGTGRLTVECLFPRCPPSRRLVAVDKSAAMLKLAAEKYPHPKIDYLPLDIVQDVEKFAREQGQFQRVYSFLTLHWIRDQGVSLSNIERLMAPGGECVLLFKRSVHFFDLFEAIRNSPRWSKYSQRSI